MFNVDQAVADWRRQMASGGLRNPALLDELESHLRGEWRGLVAAGTPVDQAFQLAVSRLGSPGHLRTEFNKLANARCWPVTICSWLFVAAIILMAMLFSVRLLAGKLSPLLFVHILSVTAGYGAAFLAGGFSILYVCFRLFHALSSDRQRALARAVLLFSQLSAGLVIAGMALGMFWYHQHFGRYLKGDPKEIGALGVFAWFVVLAALQRGGRVSERVTMLMCIGGNVVVSLAWFGAAILVNSQRMPPYLPLALSVFLGIQLVFLVIGRAPAAEAAES
jgi:hypothetical protein